MDFALILFIALLVTGAIWLLDLLFLAGRRRQSAANSTETTSGVHIRDP